MKALSIFCFSIFCSFSFSFFSSSSSLHSLSLFLYFFFLFIFLLFGSFMSVRGLNYEVFLSQILETLSSFSLFLYFLFLSFLSFLLYSLSLSLSYVFYFFLCIYIYIARCYVGLIMNFSLSVYSRTIVQLDMLAIIIINKISKLYSSFSFPFSISPYYFSHFSSYSLF